MDDSSEVQHLWQDYKKAPSQAVRDKLILHYSPLVKYVAGRVSVGLPANIEQGDLISYGIFGLIDAIDKYDPGRNIKFETYALARIKGAIIDELRAIDWVPRSVRYKAREVERSYAELEAQLHRTPTEAEVAAKMGIAVGDLHHIFSQVSYVNVVRSTSCSASAGRRATSSPSSTPSRTRAPRTPSSRSRARRRSTCSRGRSTSCPSARRSSSRSTTTRA